MPLILSQASAESLAQEILELESNEFIPAINGDVISQINYEAFANWAAGYSVEFCDAMTELSKLVAIGGPFQNRATQISDDVIYPHLLKYAAKNLESVIEAEHQNRAEQHADYLLQQREMDRDYHL
jgi:hypothetical protein